MKLKNICKYAAIAVASGFAMTGVTSCDYLDVIPPEQAGLPDAMKDHAKALGFLHSCYAGLNHNCLDGRTYFHGWVNNSSDDYTIPTDWRDSEGFTFSLMYNNASSSSLGDWEWGHFYKYIGQCLLFEEQLKTVGAAHNVNYSEAEREEWLAETRFLKAAYHFFVLREYGPIPITTDLIAMDAAMSAYPGRSHYDYCVNYIVSELDAVADKLTELGLVTRTNEVETGRATAMMCKALKARVLLYAASPLFNGEYPFPNWKNTKFTTPGYGNELISSEFDPKKWERAYQAAEEALQLALDNGYYLWDQPTITADTEVRPEDIYIPVPEGAEEVSLDFKKKVATMRYAVTTNETEGNHEIIWGNLFQPSNFTPARLPKNVFTTADSKIKSGWNGIAPHLEVVESFLTTAGTLPAEDPATMGCSERDFYTKAGLTATGREEVMRICLNREPRFYAWIAFHNGDYLTRLNNGQPKRLDMRNPAEQGRDNSSAAAMRNYSATGFLSMKHIDPNCMYTTSGDDTNPSGQVSSPCVLIRLAELYLNVAEAAAECEAHGIVPEGAKGDLKARAIEMINVIRERAGAHILDDNILASGSKSLVEWVRHERRIELWNEGHRWFDVRRWVQGNEYFGAGKRRGLRGFQASTPENVITFEEWAVPTNVDVQYRWHNRLYFNPVFLNEVYKNPQMIQAPGY